MNLKPYVLHVVTYIVSGAAMVSAIDPAHVPPQYALAVAFAGLITAVAHHGITYGKAVATIAQITNIVESK